MSSEAEEEYFAKQEIESRRKLARQNAERFEQAELEALRKAHWFRCAKCGLEMETISFKGVEIERCFGCGGTYLDAGELEKLAGTESGLVDGIVSLFRSDG